MPGIEQDQAIYGKCTIKMIRSRLLDISYRSVIFLLRFKPLAFSSVHFVTLLRLFEVWSL